MSLTGKFRHRRSWRKLVLQVEEVRARWPTRKRKARWRDATIMDLAAPELRPLIDLGKRTLFAPRPVEAVASDSRGPERESLTHSEFGDDQQAR
jgi:hypothetical protein